MHTSKSQKKSQKNLKRVERFFLKKDVSNLLLLFYNLTYVFKNIYNYVDQVCIYVVCMHVYMTYACMGIIDGT
jgi:hypothetical protein